MQENNVTLTQMGGLNCSQMDVFALPTSATALSAQSPTDQIGDDFRLVSFFAAQELKSSSFVVPSLVFLCSLRPASDGGV